MTTPGVPGVSLEVRLGHELKTLKRESLRLAAELAEAYRQAERLSVERDELAAEVARLRALIGEG